jgi:hypothetical protein
LRIRDIRLESAGGGVSARGRFEWEDSERPPVEVYFRGNESLSPGFSAAPEAFLVAGFFPAMHHGERRVALDGPVCPRLRDGLLGAGRLFQLWYGHTPPRIETQHGWHAPPEPPPDSTVSFLTGGIDSLHAIWKNHRLYPADHEGRVREALFVFGLEMPGLEDTPRAARRLAAIAPYLEQVAGDAGLKLTRIETNVRTLEPDTSFWAWEYIAPPLAAVAHALSGRFSAVLLGSSYDYPNLVPWGTHPLLDPLLGSAAMSIQHVGAARHRLEKVRDLLAWPLAIRGLLVCGNSPVDRVNCGICGKCLRAMAELISVGAPQPDTLPALEALRPDAIDRLEVGTLDVGNFWEALIPGLTVHGRSDIAGAVERYARRLRLAKHPAGLRKWKQKLVEIDSRLFGGGLRSLRRRLGR